MTPDQLCAEAQHHLRAGDPETAITLITQAITLKPRSVAYRESLGLALRAANRNEAAAAAFRHAIRLEKSSFGAHYNLGNALTALGQHAQAAQCFRRAIAIKPDYAGAHNNLGNALRAVSDPARAADAFQAALALDPTPFEVHFNLATVLAELNRQHEAKRVLTHALARNPGHIPAWLMLGNACELGGDEAGAEQALRRALALAPDDVALIANLATKLHMQGRQQEAGLYFHRALERAPADPKSHINLSNWLRETGDLPGAEARAHAGLAIAPDEPNLLYSLSLTWLSMGRLREGFAAYEWRWQAFGNTPRQTAPSWTGAPDSGGTLLIALEQGQGDMLQFLRYIPHAAARMRVVLEVYPAIRRLAAGVPGIAGMFSPGEPEPEHHAVIPLLSLPRALGLDEAPLGMETPYLFADPDASARWAARLAAQRGPKIGLAWAGSSHFAFDRVRSLPPALLNSLANKNISFVSLQKNPVAAPDMPLTDWTAELADFADTAALIVNLDLVIAVDTAVAHLAGALGKPVWLLNRFDSDWRWRRAGESTAWYPTMRIFRQPKLGDWASVMDAVRAALNDFPDQNYSADAAT